MQYVPVAVSTEIVSFVESADPIDMERKVAEAIRAAIPDFSGIGITSCYLAGGGSGAMFVCRLGFAPVGFGAIGGPILFYEAASELELPKARAAAISRLDPMLAASIEDERFAGGSLGTKFMGAIVIRLGLG
jgi:hypothetical protein